MRTRVPLLSRVLQEQIRPRAPLVWAHDLHSDITALEAKALRVQQEPMIWDRHILMEMERIFRLLLGSQPIPYASKGNFTSAKASYRLRTQTVHTRLNHWSL